MRNLLAMASLGLAICATEAVAQPANPLSADDQKIADIAMASSCRKGDTTPGTGAWNENPKDKDPAPRGFIKGVALVYAKSLCESRAAAKAPAVEVMTQPVGPAGSDALAHYQVSAPSEADRLRAVYTLGLGLGMRESSGNTTEGPDPKAKDQKPEKAEAGLYQTSFDSLDKHPALRLLMTQYKTNSGRCRLAIFLEGVKDLKKPLFGTGDPADYQKFTKECPAFATEYALVMLRVNRTHFGTINNRLAKNLQVCNKMFRDIEAVVKCGP